MILGKWKLHIGHVFSYTQAEMIARFKRMQGYDVFYPIGFDDNGLPTERLVEKDECIRTNELPRSEFRRKCINTMDKGTGAVMCATFGDSTDIEWYQKYNLSYKKVILPDGTINKDVEFIGGMKIRQAREHIIEFLREEDIPSRQWYIDVLSERERFLKAADEIRWHPAHMKTKIFWRSVSDMVL